ncbi:MAG: potassium channel family protein [Desulfobacca sp.]|uniref:potassium channel family protein n=1 Tax=Desulfobacca sp. TaxID=2067990 RepID=UPI00404ADBF5
MIERKTLFGRIGHKWQRRPRAAAGPRAWPAGHAALANFFHLLQQEKIFFLLGSVLLLIFLGGLGYALSESGEAETFLIRLGRGMWWAVVTITTVGYGDVVPATLPGRIVGSLLMLSGLIALSLLTATVASIFVERKFRRERGLATITEHDHLIILGWNRGGEQVLRNLYYRLAPQTPVVLVNTLTQDHFEQLLQTFADRPLRFVRGDFSREEILAKTNLKKARRVIILADRTDDQLPREQVDQKTLLAALAVKSLAPKVPITAELIFAENRAHLERAHVDNIIIRGEYDSSLIASSVEAEGLFKIMQTLLSPEGANFWTVKVPPRFYGKTVQEFAAVLRADYQALLVGLYTEGQKIRLEELLSPEPTAIDEFIFRKFTEAGKTHLFGRRKIEFQINPPADRLLNPPDIAVIIAASPPVFQTR